MSKLRFSSIPIKTNCKLPVTKRNIRLFGTMMIAWEAAYGKCFYSNIPKNLRQFIPRFAKPVETTCTTKKIVRVAIVGFTNSGKSTLINTIMGLHICAASKRPLTTLDYQKVLVTRDDTRIVFVDTPGILSKDLKKASSYKPTEEVLQYKSSRKVDLVGVIVDSSSRYSRFSIKNHLKLLSSFFPENVEKFLIFNKVDLLKNKFELLKLAQKYYQWGQNISSEMEGKTGANSNEGFSNIFMISALKNDGVEFMVKYLISKAHDIPEQAGAPRLTSHEDAQIIEERIRASLLEHLKEEMPYKCRCILEYLSEDENGLLVIMAIIECPSQRICSIIEKWEVKDKIIKDCTKDFREIFQRLVSLNLKLDVKKKVNS